jgi:hypothetical protein
VAEAYMIVHHPQWIRARELVQGGAIGKLVHVDAAFSYHLLDMGNIRNRPETGGGSLPTSGSTPSARPASFPARSPRPWTTPKCGARTGWTCSQGSGRAFRASPIRASPPCGCSRGRRSSSTARRECCAWAGDRSTPTSTTSRSFRSRTPATPAPSSAGPREPLRPAGRELWPHPARGRRPIPARLEFTRGTQRMIDMVLEAEGR